MTTAPMVRLSDVELVRYWPSVKNSGEEWWHGVYPSLAIAELAIMKVAREWRAVGEARRDLHRPYRRLRHGSGLLGVDGGGG